MPSGVRFGLRLQLFFQQVDRSDPTVFGVDAESFDFKGGEYTLPGSLESGEIDFGHGTSTEALYTTKDPLFIGFSLFEGRDTDAGTLDVQEGSLFGKRPVVNALIGHDRRGQQEIRLSGKIGLTPIAGMRHDPQTERLFALIHPRVFPGGIEFVRCVVGIDRTTDNREAELGVVYAVGVFGVVDDRQTIWLGAAGSAYIRPTVSGFFVPLAFDLHMGEGGLERCRGIFQSEREREL